MSDEHITDEQLTNLEIWLRAHLAEHGLWSEIAQRLTPVFSLIAEVRRLRARDEPFWVCKLCGAMFPSIPHDDDVSFCSSCIERDILSARVKWFEDNTPTTTAMLGEAHRLHEEQQARIAALEAENAELLDAAKQSPVNSPSQICKALHIQNCHACDDANCGDNTTLSIVALRARIAELEAENKRLQSELRFEKEDCIKVTRRVFMELQGRSSAVGANVALRARVSELRDALAEANDMLECLGVKPYLPKGEEQCESES